MQIPAMTDTHKAFETHALNISARAKAKSLTGVQQYAIDLYGRGFNVFPVPSAHDWKKRGEEKKPYILEPLFRNRLHYRDACTCKTCQMYNFVTLFEDSNLAVMCGATSGNLLSVDCDSKAAYDFIGAELLRRGIVFPHVWAFKSGRGGHYLMRLLEGEAANIQQKQSRFENVQVWASRHFVIVPPSVHPNGTLYEWQTPEPLTMLPGETLKPISVTALDWLGVTLKSKSDNENEDDANGLPDYAKNLSHASRHTLQHGAKQGGRNSALWNLACDLAGIGLDEGEVTNALQTAAMKCEPPYPSSKQDAPIHVIAKYALAKERKPSRSLQGAVQHGAVKDWQKAQAFALSFDWHGHYKGAASGARRVYMACIERARLDSRGKVFRASVREVSRLAGMNKDTVARYLRLLTGRNSDYKGRPLFKNVTTDKPLLKQCGQEESGAYTFAFVFGVGVDCTSANFGQYLSTDILLSENCTSEKCTIANTMPGTDNELNAFHGLGAYAFQVWRALLAQPARSLYEIAKRLKISQHTAKATVTRLMLNGLVIFSQAEGLYLANQLTDAQLAIIAANRGTQNKAQDQRERFTLEREKYTNKLVFKAKAHYKKLEPVAK